MYDEPLEETYFNWLYSKVASVAVPTPSLMFYTLLRDLHSTEFVWIVSGDDNRAQDGLDIRKEFIRVSFLPQDPPWMHLGCSVFEMLIGLARRAEFETDLSERRWFWIFLENLGLADLNDTVDGITRRVTEALDILIWRTYRRNGRGGMFPLNEPSSDQRKVELWYQLSEYLVENDIY